MIKGSPIETVFSIDGMCYRICTVLQIDWRYLDWRQTGGSLEAHLKQAGSRLEVVWKSTDQRP